MRRAVVPLLVGLAVALASACGRKGALVLPPPRLPLPVEGLTAAAADGAIVLSWTNPTKDTSGRPLAALRAVEIWVLDADPSEGGERLTGEAIEKKARLARTIPRRELAALAGAGGEPPGRVSFKYPLASASSGAPRIAFAVRVRDGRGRASEFAGPVAVTIARRDAGVDRSALEGVS